MRLHIIDIFITNALRRCNDLPVVNNLMHTAYTRIITNTTTATAAHPLKFSHARRRSARTASRYDVMAGRTAR